MWEYIHFELKLFNQTLHLRSVLLKDRAEEHLIWVRKIAAFQLSVVIFYWSRSQIKEIILGYDVNVFDKTFI